VYNEKWECCDNATEHRVRCTRWWKISSLTTSCRRWLISLTHRNAKCYFRRYGRTSRHYASTRTANISWQSWKNSTQRTMQSLVQLVLPQSQFFSDLHQRCWLSQCFTSHIYPVTHTLDCVKLIWLVVGFVTWIWTVHMWVTDRFLVCV